MLGSFGRAFFTYSELPALKSKWDQGMEYHSVCSSSLKDAPILYEEIFCDKAQYASTVIKCLTKTE